MLSQAGTRRVVAHVVEPVGRLLVRAGVTPDVITVVGTLGVSAAALATWPRGEFLVGTFLILVFVFGDTLDGTVARLRGGGTRWGAFLDSSLDRVADAAVLGSVALWYAGGGNSTLMCGVVVWSLSAALTTSYLKARAEAVGATADVGVAERSDRLVLVLTAAGFSDLLDVPAVLVVAMWVLAVATTVTVVQRLVVVRRQTVGVPLG